MTSILIEESRRYLRSSLAITGIFVILVAYLLAVFPAIKEEAELIEEAFPEYLQGLLGIEAMHTIEGFMAYSYDFFWIVLVGIYFAYLGAGMISKDIRKRKMDLTLANPVSRESVVLQKIAALWVPLTILNIGLILILYIGALLIGETLNPTSLIMVHLLSIPYLLVCAGIGLVFSTIFDRPRKSQISSIGIVFLSWFVDSISRLEPDYRWVGNFTPSRYYDETEILVHKEYAFLDAGILIGVFIILLVVSITFFRYRDV